MQMLSKPNTRPHSRYQSYSDGNRDMSSELKATDYYIFNTPDKEWDPKFYSKEQEIPLRQEDIVALAQQCPCITFKDVPYNTDVRAIQTYQRIVACALNYGEPISRTEFYRDEKFKKPCVRIYSQASGHVNLMAYANRKIDLVEIFRDATASTQNEKEFLRRLERCIFG